jgi:hypothetical protein
MRPTRVLLRVSRPEGAENARLTPQPSPSQPRHAEMRKCTLEPPEFCNYLPEGQTMIVACGCGLRQPVLGGLPQTVVAQLRPPAVGGRAQTPRMVRARPGGLKGPYLRARPPGLADLPAQASVARRGRASGPQRSAAVRSGSLMSIPLPAAGDASTLAASYELSTKIAITAFQPWMICELERQHRPLV